MNVFTRVVLANLCAFRLTQALTNISFVVRDARGIGNCPERIKGRRK